MMTTTRAAAKRAAMDDSKGDSMAADSGRNKRPALANISNDAVQPPAAKAKAASEAVPGKSKVRGHGGRVRTTSKKGSKGPGASSSSSVHGTGTNASSVSLPASGGEMPMEGVVQSVTQDEGFQGNAAAMASLERRTVQNLHISSGPLSETKKAPSIGKTSATPEPERKSWSCSLGYTSIDSNPADPQMCSIYATDIYDHLRNAELRRRPSLTFMEALQRDINASMRGILIDWLVEVAEEYKLVPDTLYLTCSYIDRYLSSNLVTRSRLQLLGVSCMLIAAKYEEIYAPQVDEFCYITDNTYRRDEVIDMEKKVLNDLHFELSTPTTKSFLRRFIRAGQASLEAPSLQLEFLGNYLAELTLVEYSFLRFLPSMVAASAVFLAKLTLNPGKYPWTPTLQHYTQYKPSQLKDCVLALHSLQLNIRGCTLPAIREKYRQSKFKSVSSLQMHSKIAPEYFIDFAIPC